MWARNERSRFIVPLFFTEIFRKRKSANIARGSMHCHHVVLFHDETERFLHARAQLEESHARLTKSRGLGNDPSS